MIIIDKRIILRYLESNKDLLSGFFFRTIKKKYKDAINMMIIEDRGYINIDKMKIIEE